MHRAATVLVVVLTATGVARSANADPVQITSGALVWVRSAPTTASVTLIGTDFSFTGHTGFGTFEPWEDCNLEPECVAGGTVDLRAYWVGSDLRGTVVYKGQTYTNLGGPMSDAGMSAEWVGTLDIPATFTGGALMAPFLFGGTFSSSTAAAQLTGYGTATLTFTPYAAYPGSFLLQEARYDFQPTPEPASILLIGTGLATLAAARRRRRGTAVSV